MENIKSLDNARSLIDRARVIDRVHVILCTVCVLTGAFWLLIIATAIHHFWPATLPARSSESQQAIVAKTPASKTL